MEYLSQLLCIVAWFLQEILDETFVKPACRKRFLKLFTFNGDGRFIVVAILARSTFNPYGETRCLERYLPWLCSGIFSNLTQSSFPGISSRQGSNYESICQMTINNKIIHKDNHNIHDNVCKYVQYIPLKGYRCVTAARRHTSESQGTILASEFCLLLIF